MKHDSDKLVAALKLLQGTSEPRLFSLSQFAIDSDFDCAEESAGNRPHAGSVAAMNEAFVSYGLPWLSADCSERWLGQRFFYFSGPLADQNRIAVVSSRLRLRLDQESWWFDLLRTTAIQCDSDKDSLIAVAGTTAYDAVVRAAELFGRSLIRFHLPRALQVEHDRDIRGWLESCFSESARSHQTESRTIDVFVSPELQVSDVSSADASGDDNPLGDRLLFASASRIHVLSCRSDGNVAALLKRHLSDKERNGTPVLIACDDRGHLPAAIAKLPTGWVPWLVEPWNHDPADDSADEGGSLAPSDLRLSSDSPLSTGSNSTLRPKRSASRRKTTKPAGPISSPDDWLLHWTRASCGPWPGEPQEEFLDSLILQTTSANRSAFATLWRIIADRMLLASSEGIRGGHRVVSFTGVPLTDFRERRIFRRHRHRFDFEPWGVAIRKKELVRLGVRPVIYGDDAVWSELRAIDKAFFQKATQGGATDNISEQEWRSIGDVDLSRLSKRSVRVFVENVQAAELVQRQCDWPVVVVPEKG